MVPYDGVGQRALGSGEVVGIFHVAEDLELTLLLGTLCSLSVLGLSGLRHPRSPPGLCPL